jgi:subtilisin family serine protease
MLAQSPPLRTLPAQIPPAQTTQEYIVVRESQAEKFDVQMVERMGLTKSNVVDKIDSRVLVARLTQQQAESPEQNDQVRMVELSWKGKLFRPLGSPEVVSSVSTQKAETVPEGIRRIDAGGHSINASDIGIAVIDTGINLSHPDLNVAKENVTFVNDTKDADDDNGHGTHVAGIIAAKRNGQGVRGVAPGAKLFAVKVADKEGGFDYKNLIKGVEWVTQHAQDYNIKLVNISLATSDVNHRALDEAIGESVRQGVTYVVAAGNYVRRKGDKIIEGANAADFVPANSPDVITVSAMADFNGGCSNGSARTVKFEDVEKEVRDDSFAFFSSFGRVIDLAAPGVLVLSTFKDGKYAIDSGTSMAAPHVTGVAALYLLKYRQDNDGRYPTPQQVREALRASAVQQSKGCSNSSSGDGGFGGDKDSVPEPLVNASKFFNNFPPSSISAPAKVKQPPPQIRRPRR